MAEYYIHLHGNDGDLTVEADDYHYDFANTVLIFTREGLEMPVAIVPLDAMAYAALVQKVEAIV